MVGGIGSVNDELMEHFYITKIILMRVGMT